MARRIVSWGRNEHIVSPNPLTTPSIVSVDSILQDKPDTSPAVQGTPNAAQSRTTNIASQVMEPSRTRTWMSTSTYPGDDTADGLFVRHPKYFFKDGNIAFLVDNTLYCVHRYFFSRDSIYFSTRFTQLDIHNHEALPTTIFLGDVECKDFDAFLSVLYPENFEEKDLCYEEWKSVLHLSTRWSFSSIRKLALNSIEPPTPHDRLLLARTYSVHDWVVPALSALCERTTPLTLSEAHQMHIEDVILISSVREHIRGGTIQVDAAEIPLLVEAEQLVTLRHGIPAPSSCESEDVTLVAGAWHSRSRLEKAEAEARAKAQEAARLRLVRERGVAAEKACQEAEKARLEAEETTRKDAEEKVRLEAEKARKDEEERIRLETEKARKEEGKKAHLEAEKAHKAEEKRARLEAEQVRKEEEERARLEAEKARKAEEEKARLEAEKARKAEEKRARLKAEKARKAEEKRARLKAEKARKAEEEKTRLKAEKPRKEEEETARLEVDEEKRKCVEEEVAKGRAADKPQKVARLTFSSSSGSSSSQSSGGGWLFNAISQAMAASGQTDEPRSPPWGPAPTGSSDLFSKRQIQNIPSPNAQLGPRNHSIMRQSSSNPFRDPLASPSATSGTAARLSASVLSSGTILVSEEVSITKGKQEGAKGEDNQTQPASETPAAPSSGQASGIEAKAQPAEAIADKQSTPSGEGDVVLVEKADSSEDDSAVVVDAPQAVTEVEIVEKAVDAWD